MAKSKNAEPKSVFVKRVKTGEGTNAKGETVNYYQYRVKVYPDLRNKKYSCTIYLPENTPLAKDENGNELTGCYIKVYSNNPRNSYNNSYRRY